MKNGLELLKQSLDSGKVVDRPDALVSFEELHDVIGMHEIEEMEQRYLTREQLEAKYGRGGKASRIMPGAKPAKPGAKPTKPAAKSKQTAWRSARRSPRAATQPLHRRSAWRRRV